MYLSIYIYTQYVSDIFWIMKIIIYKFIHSFIHLCIVAELPFFPVQLGNPLNLYELLYNFQWLYI